MVRVWLFSPTLLPTVLLGKSVGSKDIPKHRHKAAGSGIFLTTDRPANPARRFANGEATSNQTWTPTFASGDMVTNGTHTEYEGTGEDGNIQPSLMLNNVIKH